MGKALTMMIGAGLLTSGCAHLPDANLGYYLPTSEVRFKVVRTVACDAAGNPIIATAVTPTVRHFADKRGPHAFKTIALSRLKGGFSDADLKLDYYEDGRLAAVNAATTGQGEAIFKTAISLTSTVVKSGALKALTLSPDRCEQIRNFGGGKPLTLTYGGPITLADHAVTELKADADSAFYDEKLTDVLPKMFAQVLGHTTPGKPVTAPRGPHDVMIEARQPGEVRIEVRADGAAQAAWKDVLTVATFGTDYWLPIPRPVAFGKKTLGVAFAESGALKSVQYVANTGAGQALDVAQAGLTALQGDSSAAQAAEIKAEGDLIAQQQRLVACKADPANCK